MTVRTGVLLALLALGACGPTLLTKEPGGGYVANGQSVLVDDGRCPKGQVSKVTGPTSLTGQRSYGCVQKPSGGLSLF